MRIGDIPNSEWPSDTPVGELFGLTDFRAPPRVPELDMGKRSGPKQTRVASFIGVAMTVILVVMMMGGFGMIGWSAWSLPSASVEPGLALQLKGFAANLFLTGITTVYCGITGFILLENRRMRMQAIMPHVQVLSPVRSPETITLEIQNAGAAPAVDIEVRAWVMKRVGGTRTPDAVFFRGHRPALPATQNPARMQLTIQTDTGEFDRWPEHYQKASVGPEPLDVHVLLMSLTYAAVDGTTMQECIALPLSEQPTLPGDST